MIVKLLNVGYPRRAMDIMEWYQEYFDRDEYNLWVQQNGGWVSLDYCELIKTSVLYSGRVTPHVHVFFFKNITLSSIQIHFIYLNMHLLIA